MNFKINKSELKNAIQVASKALSKTIIQVERSHLLFTVVGDKIAISGTNNDLKALVEINVIDNESSNQFSFTADPKILDKLISKIDYEDIAFSFDKEELTLTVYTTENGKSYNTLQSFPTTKMLTVDDINEECTSVYKIPTTILKKAMAYCQCFLEMKEENKRYDFIIINKGVAFGSNGTNRMGFFVSTDFKPIENIKIRKIAVPLFSSVLGKIKSPEVILAEQGNNVVIHTPDKNVYFGCLKSSVESPKISLDMLKREGPYVEINRVDLNKKLKRLYATKSSIAGSGIMFNLSGAGEDSTVTLNLMANLKAKETQRCKRINDDSPDSIERLIDCKLLQAIVNPFEKENLNFYVNSSPHFFKLYEVIESDEGKYMKVGVGSYSRIIKN